MHEYETHRCHGSLGAKCSIRRYRPGSGSPYLIGHDGRWHLYEREIDFDWDYVGMGEVAAIAYCPWCGRELVTEVKS